MVSLMRRFAIATTALLCPLLVCNRSDALTIYASPDGNPGYVDGTRHPARKLSDILADLDRHPTEDIVVQLTTKEPHALTVYRWKSEHPLEVPGAACAYEITGFKGSPSARLIIRGVVENGRWLTQVQGPSLEETKRSRCDQYGIGRNVTASAERAVDLDILEYLSTFVRYRRGDVIETRSIGVQDAKINCFSVAESAHVAFESMAFKDCWLPAVYALDSNNVSLSKSFIVGSSYVFAAVSSDPETPRPSGFDVLDSVWVQDLPLFDDGSEADDLRLMADCSERRSSELGKTCPPGAMWRKVPWAVVHHGEWQAYNGALFGSRDIGGKVRFERNIVRNAYNGIRMDVSQACRRIDSCRERVNVDVSVRDNIFAYVRDNPIEPERRAAGWQVARNRFFNSYAWLSLDGVDGGPFYVWANIGWHDPSVHSVSGQDCMDGQWTEGKRWDFAEPDATKNPKQVDWRDHDPFCGTHAFGTVIKLSWQKDSRLENFYVFNNSWMIRTPIVRGGILCEMGHWNNAIEFTACGSNGADACQYWPNEPFVDEGVRPFSTANGEALFFDVFGLEYTNEDGERLGCNGEGGRVQFDYDLSNAGFPGEFSEIRRGSEAMYGFEWHGIAKRAGFRAPEAGDFTWDIATGSPARNAGCVISRVGSGPGLRCAAGHGSAPSIGAMQWNGSAWELARAPWE